MHIISPMTQKFYSQVYRNSQTCIHRDMYTSQDYLKNEGGKGYLNNSQQINKAHSHNEILYRN